ncbi:hypothetical protein SK803_09070 [Lentzea sp. BCCO 10_0856]|uniref:PASTA domain-containing protein n=1 Tax=Lentzea miocenica TaxID=3095431 RepID=A0ABU4SWT1_9PSEU|nr:hypothetical protein [Lentzea sp. BCCO 10_0856]MDX8030361.1 hypothetical protein [Lentzea sp. BCCO 10_0856]
MADLGASSGVARNQRTRVVTGLIVLGLVVWFVVPRALDWSGPWVPSFVETFWLLPLLVAVVLGAGLLVEGRTVLVLVLPVLVVGGFVAGGFVAVMRMEAPPGDEGVVPGPPGLQVAEGRIGCGSGGCWREVDATGDSAREVMRTHLDSRGYAPASSLSPGAERMCRRTGLVAAHEVCAELKDVSAGSVHVIWYVN